MNTCQLLSPIKKLFLSIVLLSVFFVTEVSAQQQKAVHLFLIGNSFSGNASTYLPQLSKEGGHELVIGRAELASCSLQRHWEAVVAAEADPNDPKGKPYKGKSLRELLMAGDWDIVTLQQYSLLSGDVETFMPYAKNLYDFIKKIKPNAEIVFHQTWAYRADSKSFGRIKGNETAKTQREMWEKSRAAYHTIAKQLGVRIIPAGDAFETVATDPAWGFKTDPNFNYGNPVYPALPDQSKSLNVGYTWNAAQKLAFDTHHANSAGCYLLGLVWYKFLFNEQPGKLNFKPEKVSNEFAAFLKKVADEVPVR